ncbi:DNA-3-methyladenine glycosylase [Actinoallomurus vinaceus]|uniref:DNA-3-methyladenine glycosylase II n=1 Tax=Actinoallomurus vinaceus TaxID=1080074 RepID=A0ABP8U2U0_9ACTN
MPVRGPFDLAASIRFLEGFTPAGRPDAGRHRGTLALAFPAAPSWRPVGVRLRQEGDLGASRRDSTTGEGGVLGRPGGERETRVLAEIDAHPDDVGPATEHARRILSLDVDGTGFAAIDDPHVARLRQEHPGLRPVLFHSPYEAACWSVIGHRIRIVQAAAIKQRMAERLGDRVGGLASFPGPERLLTVTDVPGLPPVKIERLHGIARAALDGDLDAGRLRAMETAQALVELQRIPGIGLFSAELILIRGAGHPDVFPASERRLHDEMAHEYGLHDPSPARLAAIAEAWRPYRSWVGLLLRVRRELETAEIARGRRVTR